MRTWWPALVAGLVLPLAAVAVTALAGPRDAATALVVPAAFAVAGAAAPALRTPPALSVQVWGVGIAHALALVLSAAALAADAALLHTASQVCYALGFGALLLVAVGYPTGAAGRRTYGVVAAAASLPVAGALAGPTPSVLSGRELGPVAPLLPPELAAVAAGFFALGPAAAAVFAVRYARHPALRRPMRWPVLGLVLLAVLLVAGLVARDASAAVGDAVFLVAMPVLPAALVLGAARRRLPDVDRLLRQTTVVGATWVLAAAAYGVGASAAAWSAGTHSLVPTILVAALLTIVLATPLRRAVLGLADDRARLLADLERKVVELDESRRRIATAAEAERVRVERDLHDGVQQEVLALMTAVEVARARGLTDDEADALAERARGLYESVRAVSHGVRPAVLEDHGLRAAAEGLARQCPVPTTVEGDGTRWPPEVEGALYFMVAEALTNVAKHSGAARARVLVSADGVEVSDDGAGGVDLSRGTGLPGLRDRLEAVGCVLVVTRIAGWTVVAARTAEATGTDEASR